MHRSSHVSTSTRFSAYKLARIVFRVDSRFTLLLFSLVDSTSYFLLFSVHCLCDLLRSLVDAGVCADESEGIFVDDRVDDLFALFVC